MKCFESEWTSLALDLVVHSGCKLKGLPVCSGFSWSLPEQHGGDRVRWGRGGLRNNYKKRHFEHSQGST